MSAPTARPKARPVAASTRTPSERSGPAQSDGPPAPRQVLEAVEARNIDAPATSSPALTSTATEGEATATAAAVISGPPMNATSMITASSA